MEYHIVKRVLTRQCIPPGKVMMLFRRVPRACDVSGDGMDSLLECLMLGMRGFILLRPIMASA
jgi:hypothetical protein